MFIAEGLGFPRGRASFPPVPWGRAECVFSLRDVRAVRVEWFERAADSVPARGGISQDPPVLRGVVSLLERFSAEADDGVMVKMSPDVEVLQATFYNESAALSQIRFYDRRLQRPNTSFAKEAGTGEDALYKALYAILKGKS